MAEWGDGMFTCVYLPAFRIQNGQAGISAKCSIPPNEKSVEAEIYGLCVGSRTACDTISVSFSWLLLLEKQNSAL